MGEQSNRGGLNAGETCASIAPRPLRSLEAAHRTERGRHQSALPFRELRPPDIEQQHHAQLLAEVPGLVLHAVVEHYELTFAPRASLVADPQRTNRGPREIAHLVARRTLAGHGGRNFAGGFFWPRP